MIANLYREADGNFVFEYCENPKYDFPGFDSSVKRHVSEHLWDQISFRVPNSIRNQSPSTPLEDLLQQSEGKLATDHFEFELVNDN